jgi:hypothetical protein
VAWWIFRNVITCISNKISNIKEFRGSKRNPTTCLVNKLNRSSKKLFSSLVKTEQLTQSTTDSANGCKVIPITDCQPWRGTPRINDCTRGQAPPTPHATAYTRTMWIQTPCTTTQDTNDHYISLSILHIDSIVLVKSTQSKWIVISGLWVLGK